MNVKSKPLLFISVLIYLVFIILHPRISIYSEIVVFLFAIVVFFSMIYGVFRFNKFNLLIILLGIVYFIQATISSGFISGISYLLSFFIMISPIFLADLFFISNVFTIKEKIILTISILACFLYCFISTLVYLNLNSMAVREMASFSGDIDFSLKAIGGGYVFLFALMAISPFMIYCFKVFKKISLKLLSLLIWLLIEFFIIKCDVTIAFVLSVIFAFMAFFINRKYYLIISSVIIVLIFLFLYFSINDNLINISDLSNDSYIEKRITSLIEGDTTAGGRTQLINISIDTIIRYPLFGAGIRYGFDYYNISNYVGNHSDFFDIPAKFGLPFAFILLYIIVSMSKKLINTFNTKEKKRLYIIILLLMLISSILDPIFNTNMLMAIFVFVPLFFEIIDLLCFQYIGGNQNVYNSIYRKDFL